MNLQAIGKLPEYHWSILEWNLVSDENFPDDEKILLYDGDDYYVGIFLYKDDDGINQFSGKLFPVSQPTHWMHLPPKPEVNNE